ELRVDQGRITGDDAALAQAAHPLETGGRRHVAGGGQILIGDPSILLQHPQDAAVGVVQLVFPSAHALSPSTLYRIPTLTKPRVIRNASVSVGRSTSVDVGPVSIIVQNGSPPQPACSGR